MLILIKMSIFNLVKRKDERSGVLIKFDPKKFSSINLSHLNDKDWPVVEIKKHNLCHVFIIDYQQGYLEMTLKAEEQDWYTLQNVSTYKDLDGGTVKIGKLPSSERKCNVALLVYPSNTNLKAYQALSFTEEQIGLIEELDSYDDAVAEELQKETEKNP